MTDRKTLQLRDPSQTAEAPALKKKGRGWEISEKRLDALHDMAREKRRHSSEAHKALAKRFAEADLGRYKFTRHMVIGSAIVDFGNHVLGLALAIDEPDQNETLAKRRDKSLEEVDIKVVRIPAEAILTDMDAVLRTVTVAMRERIAMRKEKARAHAAANPNQHYSRPNRPVRSGGGPRRNHDARD